MEIASKVLGLVAGSQKHVSSDVIDGYFKGLQIP
jgi:hypothetical protein